MAPTTSLQKAERERDSVKATITFLETALADHTTTPLTEDDIGHYLAMVTSTHEDVITAHRAICVAAPPDMDPYNAEHIKLLRHLSAVQRELRSIKRSLAASSSAPTSSHSSSTVDDIRLPKLELPTFNGNLQDWMPFRDIFTTTVHDNPKLSKAQKLTYLKTSLTGEAARQIKALTLTDANYDIAWTQITSRYHNDRELLFSILHRFVKQHDVSVGSSVSLRSLIDVSTECFRSLDVLKQPVEHWDSILLYFMFQKLDSTSKELWEQTLKDSSIPKLKDFIEFLEQRARALAARGSISKAPKPEEHHSKKVRAHHVQSVGTCKACPSNHHRIYQCPNFHSMSIPERSDVVKKQSLCFNCLQEGHSIPNCKNEKTCHTCNGRHHTLLHRNKGNGPDQAASLVLNHHCRSTPRIPQTILATALVSIQDRSGQTHTVRALLDGGSTASFITESCIAKLGLPKSRLDAEVSGLASSSVGTAKHASSLLIRPHFASNISYTVNCLLLRRVTGPLPTMRCDPTSWPHLRNLQLADPDFHTPANVDMLLGSDVFWNILQDGKKKSSADAPVALSSTLGWLVAGNTETKMSKIAVHVADITLDDRLRLFWELEAVPETRAFTTEETTCEHHFSNHHRRDESGRYTVKLPFKSPPIALGESRDIAVQRLKQLERRFKHQPETQLQYIDFMREYLSLGHMEEVPTIEVQTPTRSVCYIPHHFVRKESSTTTKLRVVFDASSKTATGNSLNDALMVGPTLQDTLVSIIMRFRTHVIALTADIAKMYRQIRVDETDSDMQRIVWREAPSQVIKDYRLTTVTYGTASAPYLATKALQQLAVDEQRNLPSAAAVVLRDFYIDDLMSGASSVESALVLQAQLLELTARGGHDLRKWSSNSSEVLDALPADMRENKTLLQIETDPTIKALGIYWNPTEDVFLFKLAPANCKDLANLTKRKLLSEIAKIFDPLGWLAPIIIRAKILLQRLWALSLQWDDLLPSSIRDEWAAFQENLTAIETITIPRCTVPHQYVRIKLCGFSDASQRAYAGVVYLCVYFDNQPSCVSIITSKTRVAPVKTVSVPRLELCGAVLLAQLMTTVESSLHLPINEKLAWTDSTVVLDWLKSQPSRWKTFVANRVTEVLHHLPFDHWNHVSGVENPADCASRGIHPTELPNHDLWWNGPSWLQDPSFKRIQTPPGDVNLVLAEEKSVVVCSHATTLNDQLFTKYSSFRTLRRLTAWVRRFYYNCRIEKSSRRLGSLTPAELDEAVKSLVKAVQLEHFHTEIRCLTEKKPLPLKSSIVSLNPFLDSSFILRVGGRLNHSSLSEDQKNPMLLPRHHKFNQLLICSLHLEHLHGGTELLLSVLRQNYWIIRAKDAIRHQLKKCVICTRHRGSTLQQMMGDLPSSRVTPSPAFSKCGVDYAGPFQIKSIVKRSKATFKAYLALFVCFTTRAIHLEVVTDMSTPAFLAALKRFIARRGRPSDIFSDCGTNFVGAAKELKEMFALQKSPSHNETIANDLSSIGIQWHFNPPSAPHFGGLWEAGVKSAKYHLTRIMRSTRLTFEELTTVATQIEGTLNSRPLTPVSSDVSDLAVLTPGHFLIGRPLTYLPESDIRDEKIGRLSRWQLLQQINQNFWHRWSNEYLSRLQQRPKWLRRHADISIGNMVLIKDERLPPLKWQLGRVTTLHTGKDGMTRVATIRTSTGEVKRPIVKLCLLPLDNDEKTEDTSATTSPHVFQS